MSGLSILKTCIVGMQYHPGANERLKTMGHAQQVILRAEPDNPHDPYAIAVHHPTDDLHLGYIPRDKAPIIRQGMVNGPVWAAIDGVQPKLHILYHTKFQEF